MESSVGLTRDQARQLVEGIAQQRGRVPAQEWAEMPERWRTVFKSTVAPLADGLAASLSTLARNLYSSKSRFIYELFQNADDNHFTKAQSADEHPSVTFLVYHDKLVVECNEDGFTEENVKAICDIDKSSKQGAQGYIGEKGIGFKSTFMAAWKVQIQSGPFSFYFEHRDDDSGLGMITPIWLEPEEELSRPMTVTTLYFHDNADSEKLQTRREEVTHHIFKLQAKALLFLQNLRTVKVVLFDENRQPTYSKQTTLLKFDNESRVELHTIESQGGISWTSVKNYFVSSHLAEGLAKNENRKYTEAEDQERAYSTAKVMIALPLTHEDVPIVEAQELFAFLPIRKFGFNFLIHSDFVTQANRQDIVTTSERNIGLRQAVAVTFAKAIQELCMHPRLRYQWVQYLPRQNNLPVDDFWRELVLSLKQTLSQVPILFSRDDTSDSRYKMTKLRRLDDKHLDRHGNPLLPDSPRAKYLSDQYSATDLDILQEYGLQYLQAQDIVEKLHIFLKQPSWKAISFDNRDEDWHSRAAKLVMELWNDKNKDWKSQLRTLPILPLSTKVLRSPSAAKDFYFPDIHGVSIPNDVDVSMILPAATANKDWRNLYRALGAKTARFETVRKLIFDKYRPGDISRLNVTIANNHLRYLFQTHVKDPPDNEEAARLVVFDHEGRARNARTEIVYIPGNGDWSPGNLLKPPAGTPEDAHLEVSFIHPIYLQDEPKSPDGYEKSWQDWLYSHTWIEERIMLFKERNTKAEDAKEFSKHWLFVAQHRSDMMVSRLQSRWSKISNFWEAATIATKRQRELKVLCLSGTRHTLEGTFAPFPFLLGRCRQLLTNINAVPFVKVSGELEDSDAPNWVAFGTHFGVGVTDDLDFSLAVLRAIASGNSTTKGIHTQTIIDLYLRIYAQCIASENKDDSQKKVGDFCVEHRAVLCSPLLSESSDENTPNKPVWVSPTHCLWNAIGGFTSKQPVKHIWEATMATISLQDRGNLEQFFRHTLLIGDITSGDIVEELRQVADLCEKDPEYSPEPKFLHDTYQMLHALKSSMDESELLALKEMFKDEDLIYAPVHQPRQWFSTVDCVWSSEGKMLGKPCLESFYPDLEELFVDYFEIPRLNFALVYQQLIGIGDSTLRAPDAKILLESLAALLKAEKHPRPEFGEEAKSSRVFPVRTPGGGTEQLSALDEFAIVDREHYAAALKERIKFLDFSLDEVQRLKPLLRWAGLDDRYLSRLVSEQTVVDDGPCSIDSGLTYTLTKKAGAFVSVAKHFESPLASPKSETLHSTLCKSRVYIAKTITSTLVFQQGDQSITLPIGSSELHIEKSKNGGFDIYVPSDPDARDFCVASRLPLEFAARLMKCKPSTVDAHVVSVVASIMHAKPSNTSRVLIANGINVLDPKVQEEGVMDIDDPAEETMTGSAFLRPSTPTFASSGSINPGHSPFSATKGSSSLPIPGNQAPASSPTRFQPPRNEAYAKLLDKVVREACKMPIPPREPTSRISASTPIAKGNQMPYEFWATDLSKKREMIGAAGEFFVFKLLSNLQPELPGFNGTCWQSTARQHVKIHPEYSSIETWSGDEKGKSDISYNDDSNVLTLALLEKGYLDESWRNVKPEYSIEVKTTMSDDMGHPFYLSREQYLRMQSISNASSSGSQKKEIYAIFRIYGLGSGNIGLKIYIDPEAARKDGLLQFEPNDWVVTPRLQSLKRKAAQMESEDEESLLSATQPTGPVVGADHPSISATGTSAPGEPALEQNMAGSASWWSTLDL